MKIPLVPRGLRPRLLLAVVVALGAALAALIASFNLVLSSSLSNSVDDRARGHAEAALARLTTVDGRLVETEAPDDSAVDSEVWIFSRGRILEHPRVADSLTRAARALEGGPRRFFDVPASDTRLYALPALTGGTRAGTVVAGVSLEAYEETTKTALIASFALAAVLLGALALASRWLLKAAFRPVERMTRDAAAWSERELDRRFGLGEPHDELTRLAATLDGLLDRLAASLRHEQRFSAEMSHELRTPLAKIRAEAELALRRERPATAYREALEQVLRSTAQLEGTIETLVLAAQQEASGARGTEDAYDAALRVAEACSALAAEHEVELSIERPAAAIRVGVDGDLVERILQPVIENACRYGRSRVRVAPVRNGNRVVFTVEDDGPGVLPDESDLIFQPGVRGTIATARADGGAGLGLALARRLARSVRGDLDVDPGYAGGRFLLALPAA